MSGTTGRSPLHEALRGGTRALELLEQEGEMPLEQRARHAARGEQGLP